MSERKSMLRHRARAAQNRIQWSVLSWNLLCIFFCHLITEANNNRIISLNQLNCYVIGRLGMTSDRVHKAHSASRASGHRCFDRCSFVQNFIISADSIVQESLHRWCALNCCEKVKVWCCVNSPPAISARKEWSRMASRAAHHGARCMWMYPSDASIFSRVARARAIFLLIRRKRNFNWDCSAAADADVSSTANCCSRRSGRRKERVFLLLFPYISSATFSNDIGFVSASSSARECLQASTSKCNFHTVEVL